MTAEEACSLTLRELRAISSGVLSSAETAFRISSMSASTRSDTRGITCCGSTSASGSSRVTNPFAAIEGSAL